MKTIKVGTLALAAVIVPIAQANPLITDVLSSTTTTSGVVKTTQTIETGMLDFTSMADKLYDSSGAFKDFNLGEKGFSDFVFGNTSFTLSITGGTVYSGPPETTDPDDRHAYLDKGHAGLGVCGVLDSKEQCNPASDDNVTGILSKKELLTFIFTPVASNADIDAVFIDNLWINNTHDPNPSGQITSSETVMLDGSSTAAKGNGYAPQNAVLNPTGRSYNDWDGNNGTQNLNADVANSFSFLARDLNDGSFGFTLGFGGAVPEQFYVSAMQMTVNSTITQVPTPGSLLLLGAGLMGLRFARRGNRQRA